MKNRFVHMTIFFLKSDIYFNKCAYIYMQVQTFFILIFIVKNKDIVGHHLLASLSYMISTV